MQSTTLAPATAKPFLAQLQSQKPDALLALIGLYRADPRPDKIDVGVGVYRDRQGHTPVFAAVKQAEGDLLRTQDSKSYLGPEGDPVFIERLQPIIFGAQHIGDPRLTGVQTPGGTGALRLAAELIATAAADTTVWLTDPTWPNHAPVFAAAGLRTQAYPYFDPATQTVDAEGMLAALRGAKPGDVVLIHGCCHNPTGAELTAQQWRDLVAVMVERDLTPLVDLAYQGLGAGLEADAAGLQLVVDARPEVIVAYSCDKNFGLYRERVGGLWVRGADADGARVARENMLSLARANWSMPPDHGAAVVRTILASPDLTEVWRAELDDMRLRMAGLRQALAAAHPVLAPLAVHTGLFALLPLTPTQVIRLREDHGIYMAGNGRINIAGLQLEDVDRFAAALAPYLGDK